MTTSATYASTALWPVQPIRWLNVRTGLIALAIAQLTVILGAAFA